MEIEIRKKGSLKKKRNDEEVYFLKHFQNQSILEFKTSLMDLEMDKLKAEDVNNGSKFSCMVILLCMCSELDCDYHYWTWLLTSLAGSMDISLFYSHLFS